MTTKQFHTHESLNALLNNLANEQQDNATMENLPDFDDMPPVDYIDNSQYLEQWEIELLNSIERLNKSHAQVAIGGKHKIARKIPATYSPTNRDELEFFSQNELEKLYQNDLIKVGERKNGKPILKNRIRAWAEHPKSKVYRGGVIFKPNAPENPHYLNTWIGFAVKPAKNIELLNRINYHIEQVVCNGDSLLIDYFYNWIAYTFQHPDKPAGAALVLRGEKGTGKGTIGHFLKNIWNSHGLHISNAKHLVNNFNGHLADTCFLFADEAFFSGDRQHENVLKALITEPVLMVERKGIDAIQQPNYLKVFMATNNDWAVPASKDERRYCVLDVSNKKKGDKVYFDHLHADIDCQEVQAAFLYEMLNRDISNFHTGNIPESDGLKEQRLHSLNSVGQWLVDCLDTGQFETSNTESINWQTLMSAKELFNSYRYWCDNQRKGEYTRVNQTIFGRYLSSIGFDRHKSDGTIYRKMLNLETATKLFEQYERLSLSNTKTIPN